MRARYLLLINAVISLVISATVSVGSIYYYNKNYAQKVIAVNFNSFVQEQSKEFMQGKITKDEFTKNLQRGVNFVKNQPKNTMVLTGESVLRGNIIDIK